MRKFPGLAAVFALLVMQGTAPAAEDYAAARADLVRAYQAEDFTAMIAAARRALAARPGYPGARFNLALAHALHGDAQAALDELDSLARAGIEFGVENLTEFAALQQLADWPEFAATVERLRRPIGDTVVAAQLDDGKFVPEGIALDEDGALYLGSIRRGLVVRVADEVEVLSERQGHWSVFGMRFHDDGSLWFASAAVAQFDGAGDDLGKTGLFRLDVDSGDVTHAAILPQVAERQVLGDLVIDGDRIYTTDSLTGALYRYDVGNETFTTLVEPGTFGSPQGLVFDATGDYLYVADYIGGLFRVAVADGRHTPVRVRGAASPYGIDGLYRHNDRLVAIQNGIRPHRVVSMRLAANGLEVDDTRILAANLSAFDEPTLGAMRADGFYFVANSHWNRFDQENRLPDGLSGPIVLKLAAPND
jgi:sugar lactone lactonase YvrE